jgi:hypothetical protein
VAEFYRAIQFYGTPAETNITIPAPLEIEQAHPRGQSDKIWLLAVDPGDTTGICIIAVPRLSILGDEPRDILHRETFDLTGSLRAQVGSITRLARSLGDRILIVCEDFDLGGNRLAGEASEADVSIPIRMGAALQYAVECGHVGHSALTFQGRTIAFGTATDARLKKWGMWDVGSPHKRDATRHAIVMLRRLSSRSVDPELIWGDDD